MPVSATRVGRREFVQGLTGTAATMSVMAGTGSSVSAHRQSPQGGRDRSPSGPSSPPKVRFAVIGINHSHIYGQASAVLRAGGELVSMYAKEPDLTAAFVKQFPQVKVARSETEILEDPSLHLVLSSAIPDERAPLGIRVMRHGKDYMADKPGITTLAQLAEARQVQAETRRIYSIMYSERFENRATVKAAELARAGAIGRVIQTIGLGPHRMNAPSRPGWFFDRARYGGILCDIASHQADQFLYFTGSTRAEVVAAQVGNVHHPQYPKFEDFGDVMFRGDAGTGYVRVDWFTPGGLATWGDTRLTVLGTDGYIEVRKNIDVAGRPGESHLFVVDHKETRYVDCAKVPLPYGQQLVADVIDRTDTAMTQAHCFMAMELVLTAQQQAQTVGVPR